MCFQDTFQGPFGWYTCAWGVISGRKVDIRQCPRAHQQSVEIQLGNE